MSISKEVREFVEFVGSNPKDLQINHGSFYTCAVGCFLKSVGRYEGVSHSCAWAEKTFGPDGFVAISSVGRGGYATYGELHEKLCQLFPVQDTEVLPQLKQVISNRDALVEAREALGYALLGEQSRVLSRLDGMIEEMNLEIGSLVSLGILK